MGSKINIYIDKKSLVYIEKNKLGAPHILWLSESKCFDFDIEYRMCKSNKAADTLSYHLKKMYENSSSKESQYERVLYATVCDGLAQIVKGMELLCNIKQHIQERSINSKIHLQSES